MRKAINWLYFRARGHMLPVELPVAVLRNLLFTRTIEAARGAFRSTSYSRGKLPHFVARNVRISNSHDLSVGRNVAIGFGTKIEAFSINGVSISDSVTIGDFASLLGSAVIREPGVGIRIGAGSAIGIRNTIWGQGGVVIGENCLFGPNVLIVSENHVFDNVSIPINKQGGRRSAVEIENDCWIGAGVQIMPGVRIGEGSVIAAGAIVTKSIPAFSIAMGIPAKVTGVRGRKRDGSQ